MTEKTPNEKKQYSTPRLEEFGNVVDLTRGNVQGAIESGPGQGGTKKP